MVRMLFSLVTVAGNAATVALTACTVSIKNGAPS